MVRNESETSEKCATSWKMPLWFFEYGWRCFRQIWNQLALGMWWVNKKNGAKVDIEWMRCKSTNLDSIVQHPALKISASVSCAKKNSKLPLVFVLQNLISPYEWDLIACLSSSNIQHTHIFCLSFTLQKETPRIFGGRRFSFPALPFISNLEIRKYGRVFHGISQDLPFLVLGCGEDEVTRPFQETWNFQWLNRHGFTWRNNLRRNLWGRRRSISEDPFY